MKSAQHTPRQPLSGPPHGGPSAQRSTPPLRRALRLGLGLGLGLLSACSGGATGAAVGTSAQALVLGTDAAAEIVQLDGPGPISAGGPAQLIFAAVNRGAQPVQVRPSLTLPANVEATSFECLNGPTICPVALFQRLSDLGSVTLPPGERVDLLAYLKSSPAARQATLSVTAEAVVEGPSADEDPSNNSASASADLFYTSDLSVRHSTYPATGRQGETLTYILTAGNSGPSDGYAEVGHLLPAASFDSIVWSCAAIGDARCGAAPPPIADTPPSGTGSFQQISFIGAGAQLRYTIQARLRGDALGPVESAARVLSVIEDGAGALFAVDGNQADNASVVTTTVSAAGPDCAAARPSLARLWPPNGRLVPVRIDGLGGAPVSILSVMQDEPVGCQADALIAGASARLRAERDGSGGGRVYRLRFSAGAPGATCQGEVTVCVPKTPGGTCWDDGARYDSTRASRPGRGEHGRDRCDDDRDDDHDDHHGGDHDDDCDGRGRDRDRDGRDRD